VGEGHGAAAENGSGGAWRRRGAASAAERIACSPVAGGGGEARRLDNCNINEEREKVGVLVSFSWVRGD
jgi:hypothetical protein